MSSFNLIASTPFWLAALWVAGFNTYFAITRNARQERREKFVSSIFLVGGMLASLALILTGQPRLQSLWWLPLLIDPWGVIHILVLSLRNNS